MPKCNRLASRLWLKLYRLSDTLRRSRPYLLLPDFIPVHNTIMSPRRFFFVLVFAIFLLYQFFRMFRSYFYSLLVFWLAFLLFLLHNRVCSLRTLYGLWTLRAHGMPQACLQLVFRSTAFAKLLCLPRLMSAILCIVYCTKTFLLF